MKLNAIELRDEHNGMQIKATVMLTSTNASTLHLYGVSEGDTVEVTGELRTNYSNGVTMGRAVRTVVIEVWSVNGETIHSNTKFMIVCNMGSHITVDLTDPMDVESEGNLIGDDMRSEMRDEDGEMITPAGPVICGMRDCYEVATHVAKDIDGETNIPVCRVDSYNTRWWGVWPIEEDSQFSEAVGTSEREVDSVPIGTNRATPDWTGRVESNIMYAEFKVRAGMRGRDYLVSIVDHIAQLRKRRVFREYQAMVAEATDYHSRNLISRAYRNQMILEACEHRDGVSLAKA